jgi:hypothetical protein
MTDLFGKRSVETVIICSCLFKRQEKVMIFATGNYHWQSVTVMLFLEVMTSDVKDTGF